MFFGSFHWKAVEGDIAARGITIPYHGDLQNPEAVSRYLTNADEIFCIGHFPIPQDEEVKIILGTYCAKCGCLIKFDFRANLVLNPSPEKIGEVISDEARAEMHTLPTPSAIFVNCFMEKHFDWMYTDESLIDVESLMGLEEHEVGHFNLGLQ